MIKIGKRMVDVSNETLAYTAGLFDGEGCVTSQPHTKRKDGSRAIYIAAIITNTNSDIIDFLHKTYGGYKYCHQVKGQLFWKPRRTWRLTWGEAVDFLSAIRPWIIIKTKQIDVAIRWQQLRPGSGRWSNYEDQKLLIDQIFTELKILNTRGVQEVPLMSHDMADRGA